MIVVLCANPAVDVTYQVGRVTRGSVHGVTAVHRRAGGKGTNTARVLAKLGAPVTLVAPLGGAAADEFAAELGAADVPLVIVPVASPPRSSVCVLDGEATVFNEPGPPLREHEWDATVAAVLALAPEVLVLAGSLPAGVPPDAYGELVRASTACTIVDAKGPALAGALPARPDVVTPNLLEARQIVDVNDAAEAAVALCEHGARAALVSAGVDGLVVASADGRWRARPPRALTGNPTGAGDAVTAEIARGLHDGLSWQQIAAAAVATSAACVACPTAGDFDAAVRAELYGAVEVEEVGDAARRHR